MSRTKALLVAAMAGFFGAACPSVFAANQMWEEYDRLISKRTSVGALGTDLFGDELSYYTGGLSFTQTDLSIPGNDALPVAVTRTTAVEARHGFPEPSLIKNQALFADWELDIPNISTTVSEANGWTGADGTAQTRCSQPSTPKTLIYSNGAKEFPAEVFWYGYQMKLPGGRGGEMLAARSDVRKPTTGGPYTWVTAGWTYVSCLPTLTNAPGQGEGFLAVDASGTKYWFNWLATYFEQAIKERKDPPLTGDWIVNRKRMALYATRIEDRFGNWVTYSYSNAADAPIRLTSIDSKDLRSITFDYTPEGFISHAATAGKTWTYEYTNPTSSKAYLSAVVQPDQKRWTLNIAALSGQLNYESEPSVMNRNCMDPGAVRTGSYTGTMTHPSGAVAEFTVSPIRFGRSNVLAMCRNVKVYFDRPNDPNDDVAIYPIAWDSLALTHKRISGPALTTADWSYDYLPTISWFYSGGGTPDLPVCTSGNCVDPQCTSDACAGSLVTTVTGPGPTYTRYTFGNSYRYNEGKLLSVEEGSSASSILRTKKYAYELSQSGLPFPTPIGTSMQYRSGSGFSTEYLRPQVKATTLQQGENFNATVGSPAGRFDEFANPLGYTRSSSLGMTRSETTEYSSNYALWVLSQPSRQTVEGVETSRTDFDSLARPWHNYAFGQLQQTLGYNADGTLDTVTDARSDTTRVSGWKRGIPGLITYPATPEAPAGATKSALVNDLGWITSVTDENGYATGYGYDDMGRLASIAYPPINGVPSNPTTIVFEPVAQDEYGIPSGHWRRKEETGNARKLAYFDALWRPIVEEVVDTTNMGGTNSWVAKRYDIDGHATFVSYPRNLFQSGWVQWSAVNDGTHTDYDALGRVTRTQQDSELGLLTTTTEYLPGLTTRVTNPRGQATTMKYEAYDAPSYDQPSVIDQPAGVRTVIVRDKFGNTKEVTRSGPGG